MTALWLALLAAQDLRLEPRAEAAAAWIDGSIRFDEKPAVGDRLDVRDDLDWADPAFRPELGVDATLGRHVAGLSVAFVRFRGSTEFNTPTRWNESLFPPGQRVDTQMEVYELAVDYRFAVLDAGLWRLEAGVSARYWRFHLEMETASLPDDDDNLGAFVPELDLRASWRLTAGVDLEGRVSGMAYTASGLSARTFGIRLGLRWAVSAAVVLGASVDAGALRFRSGDPEQLNEIDLRGVAPAISLELTF